MYTVLLRETVGGLYRSVVFCNLDNAIVDKFMNLLRKVDRKACAAVRAMRNGDFSFL